MLRSGTLEHYTCKTSWCNCIFQLVYLGLIEVDVLDLYLNLSEMGRDYLERYFNLKTELYFTYTHLVCRTALNGT